MYIAPGRGRQSIGDKILMTTKSPFLFAHMLQVPKWSLRNLILYTFLMILYMYVYSPGGMPEDPLGTHFWCQHKALITSTICCKFQTNLFEVWFYTRLFMFFHMYIAPSRGRQHIGDNILMTTDIRHLAPPDGCACAFEEWVYEGRKVP